MRILVLADLDDLHWRGASEGADLVVACGDVADALILEAAAAAGCDTIFAVKGNHDSAAPFPDPIVDLHLAAAAFQDTTFAGLNGCWRYKPRGHFLYDQHEAQALVERLPAAQVLVSHNSPLGVHDRDDEVHLGFAALHSYLRRSKPKLLLHGHHHVNQETRVGDTLVTGVWGSRIVEWGMGA